MKPGSGSISVKELDRRVKKAHPLTTYCRSELFVLLLLLMMMMMIILIILMIFYVCLGGGARGLGGIPYGCLRLCLCGLQGCGWELRSAETLSSRMSWQGLSFVSFPARLQPYYPASPKPLPVTAKPKTLHPKPYTLWLCGCGLGLGSNRHARRVASCRQ